MISRSRRLVRLPVWFGLALVLNADLWLMLSLSSRKGGEGGGGVVWPAGVYR
jgi:hypothetical protein